jgi:AraC-like DNA-binding protein
VSVEVRSHVSAEHEFALVSRPADPRLRDLVRRYVDFRERTAGPLARREHASPEAVVLVDLGDGWTVGEGDGDRHGSFAGGLTGGPTTVGHGGRARAVQIDLTPLGTRALLGVPLGALAQLVVPLDALLGPDAGRLAEQLDGAPGSEARFALLDRLLLRRAAAARSAARPDVAWAWRRLVEADGALRVDALARELGCSRRHLTGRFAEEVGLPPKTFARVLRFRRATDLLLGAGERRLGEVAAACGYADQAHFNRDVRAFAGATPTELLAERRPIAAVA